MHADVAWSRRVHTDVSELQVLARAAGRATLGLQIDVVCHVHPAAVYSAWTPRAPSFCPTPPPYIDIQQCRIDDTEIRIRLDRVLTHDNGGGRHLFLDPLLAEEGARTADELEVVDERRTGDRTRGRAYLNSEVEEESSSLAVCVCRCRSLDGSFSLLCSLAACAYVNVDPHSGVQGFVYIDQG